MQPIRDKNAQSGVPRSLPAELLQLTYQNRLRAIGRQLDISMSRTMLILEVEGGFIVRTVSREDLDIGLREFTDDTYAERMIAATEARGQGERMESPSQIAPTGYEDLLRSVGRALDDRGASGIVIGEKLESIVVAGDDLSGESPEPFDVEYDDAGITRLLDEAFRLRGNVD